MTDLLDDVLRATFTERAADVSLPPSRVHDARRRGQRQRLAARSTAAVGIGALVAGGVAGAVALTGGSGVHAAPPVATATLPVVPANLFAAFPLTPGWLPDDLRSVAPVTAVLYDASIQELTYQPKDIEPPSIPPEGYPNRAVRSMLQISTSDKPISVVQVATPTPIDLAGTPGQLIDGHLLYNEVSLTFRQPSGRYVAITADLRYASVDLIRQVALSLTDAQIAATPPFRFGTLPVGFTTVGLYQPSEVTLEPTGTHDPNGHSAKGNGVIVGYSHLSTRPVGQVVRVGDREGIVGEDSLWVALGNGRYLQVLSRVVPRSELIDFAASVTVLPAAQPIEDGIGLGG